jgi:membrane associated rhomboid family serine protease
MYREEFLQGRAMTDIPGSDKGTARGFPVIPLKDTIPRIGFPWMTWALIILNGIVFVFEMSIPHDVLEGVLYLFGLVPARMAYPRQALSYLPFLSNMFLHGGWLHIIGNMWFLHIFGPSVEDRMGPVRFLIFYLLAGIVAGITFFLFAIHSRVPVIGASGAIAGVMGAYMVMFPNAKILTLIPILFIPFFIEVPAFFYIGFWFFLQLISGTLSLSSTEVGGGIAWWGHVGGFAAGMILLPLFKKHSFRKHFPDETYRYVNR